MASSSGEDWSVLVTPTDKSSTLACRYILPSSTPLAAVRRRWEADMGALTDSQLLRAVAGHRVDEALTLQEVGETFPDSRMVTLQAEGALEVTVRLYADQAGGRRLRAFPSDIPEDLFPAVRRLFEVEETRALRLLMRQASGDDSVLALGRSLASHCVTADSVLLLDLSVLVSLRHLWTSAVEQHRIFASEPWATLMPRSNAAPQRLQLSGRALNLSSSVAESLSPASVARLPCVEVELHQARQVTLVSGSRMRSRLVWPTQRPADIAAAPLTVNGVVLDSGKTLADAHLSEFAMVRTEEHPAWVLLSDGFVVRLPTSGLATVGDLHAATSRLEGSEAFLLRRGSLRLEEHDVKLEDIALGVAAPLTVERSRLQVSVWILGRDVRWEAEARCLRFSDLRDRVVQETGLCHRRVTESTLLCAGCGRRLTRGDERWQRVPADCCRVRSLQLTAAAACADVSVQCTSLDEKTANADGQTVVSGDSCVPVEASQSRDEADCQLYVWVENGVDVRMDRAFRPPVTVGEVRRAIAEKVNARPLCVQMERWTSHGKDGGLCYQVCNAAGSFLGIGSDESEFGTAAGVISSKKEAPGHFLVKLRYDEEELAMVRGRWSVINVFVLVNAMAPCDLYIDNSEGTGLYMSPLLAQPPSGAEIREAAARELRVKSDSIQLERRSGVSPTHQLCYQVCDQHGRVHHDADTVEFASENGQVFPHSAIANKQAVDVADGRFLQIPARRNVLHVVYRHPQTQRISLLIVVPKTSTVRHQVRLPERPTIGDVRRCLSQVLSMDMARVKFDRWVATGPRGDTCVQVGDHGGSLVGITSDECEFGTACGRIYKKGELIERSCRVMCIDEEEFVVVKGRALVVNVYKQDKPSVTVDIYVSNRKGLDFSLCLFLPMPVVVGDVRAILASKLKVKLGCVKMKQWLGRTNTDAHCVQLCTPEGKFVSINKPNGEFGTADGRIVVTRLLKSDPALVELRNDEMEVVVVPGRRLVMNVSQRHPPAKKVPLFVWRDGNCGLLFSPFLPKEPTVGDLRKAIAAQLQTEPARVSLRRWTGWHSGGECVQLCTKEDGFVGIADSAGEFGKADGSVVRKERLSRLKKVHLMNDASPLVVVPGRRCIINVE